MAAPNAALPPIVIKKKVSGHGGHHGGAWKVAYADFVTAMMALFIVLWLLSSNEKVKKAVSEYFNDPKGVASKTGSALAGTGQSVFLSKQDLQKIKEELEKAMKKVPEMQKLKNQVTMTVTGEGLRIELLENVDGVFFQSGSTKPTQSMVDVIAVLSQQLGKLPNNILIEGHTDAAPYQSASGYSNWELSADRANETRRVMQSHGVRADQVKQVRGFADQSLRNKANPMDASNRRISVIVSYDTVKPPESFTETLPKTLEGAAKEGKPATKEGKPEGKAAAEPKAEGKPEAKAPEKPGKEK